MVTACRRTPGALTDAPLPLWPPISCGFPRCGVSGHDWPMTLQVSNLPDGSSGFACGGASGACACARNPRVSMDLNHWLQKPVADMDNSVSPTHGGREGPAWNGHFDGTCHHPTFLFNRFDMPGRCAAWQSPQRRWLGQRPRGGSGPGDRGRKTVGRRIGIDCVRPNRCTTPGMRMK